MLIAIRLPLLMTQVIAFGFTTALLSLFQPIPSASAQQLTGPVSQETSGTGTRGRRIENIAPTLLYPTKSLEKKDAQTSIRKPHRLIRKPQNAPVASVEPSLSGSSSVSSLPTPTTSLQNDNTLSQSKEPSSFTRSAGPTVPLATVSVAPTSVTTSGATAAGTVSTGTIPLAAAGAGNSSSSRKGNAGGRSMSKLAAEMPGLTQLQSPPSEPIPSTPPPSINPVIGASPISLSFTAQQGGANPATQAMTISNTGGGTLSWSASEAVSWLTLSPASGTGNGTVTLSATTGTLTANTYSTMVTLSAGTGVTPVTVPVTFTVATAPTISISPPSLSYTATQGAANPASQSAAVSSNQAWTASDNASWLTVSPTSGSNSGPITVSVNTATAALGANTALITVTGGGITQTITVTLMLNAPSTSSAILTWTPNTEPDLASYRVYRSSIQGVYGPVIMTVPAGTASYTATGLQVGQTYYFTITAVDAANNESIHSNEVSKSIF